MKKLGLIGYPLTHSFSKRYFEEKFAREQITGYTYDLFPIENIKEFPALIDYYPELVGLNVTIPYKESVMPYLGEISPIAKEIGAVNCLVKKEGTWKGYNTDAFGFATSLNSFLTLIPDVAFVLGTGGSSKAVIYVLKKMNMPYVQVSRTPKGNEISYTDIEPHMGLSNLFINTTPLGMHPNIDACADIPYQRLSENDFLFDLVYNPSETLFLLKGKAQGAKTQNGLEMLCFQAEESWDNWNR